MDSRKHFTRRIDILLISAAAGFAAGVIVASYATMQSKVFCIVLAVAALSTLLASVRKSTRLFYICSAVVLFCGLLGSARMQLARPDVSMFVPYENQKVILHGSIDGVQLRTSGQQFVLRQPDTGIFTKPAVAILISTKDDTPLAYGDEVEVTGKLQKPENFLTDQGTEFDYISYLYKDNIVYRMSYAKVQVLSHNHGSWIVARLLPITDWFQQSFNALFSVSEADLMGGLVLGSKQNISDEFRSDLIATGTVHIIALSGYNVTIVATSLRALLGRIPFLGQTGAAAGGVIGIIVFVLMTGAQSSAIRAGIMAIIAVLARTMGRQYAAARALIFAALCMLVYNPKYLVYDVSFQLSFLATLGIIYLTPLLDRAFHRVPKKVLRCIPLRELLSTTLGAQIGTLPFIVYKMGTLSLIALPANIFIIPAVPYAMAFGTAAGVLGKASVSLAAPVTFIAHLLLQYILRGVELFARVPHASITVKDVPLIFCVVFYVMLCLIVYKKQRILEAKKGIRVN